jgi:hypothetical protein
VRIVVQMAVIAAVLLVSHACQAEDTVVTLGDSKLEVKVSEEFKKKKPRNNLIDSEFEVPSKDEGAQAARLTFSRASGSVEANQDRWVGGFEQKGLETKKDEKAVAGQKVYLIDLVGTYKDSPGGPFAGGAVVKRENYRMLGAIIVTEKSGQHFVKYYGPKATVDATADNFLKMIEGMKSK